MTQPPIMDESEESGQFGDRFPIPIHIEDDGQTRRPAAAERASYNTYLISFTNTAPVLILPRNPRRKEAYIYEVQQASGPVPLISYDYAGIQDGSGMTLAGAGTTITVKAQREVYAWNGNRAAGNFTISVMDQFYDTD
jgi:hypothetical protein